MRLNANWYYEEVEGGVILEAEVISLSRSIPYGLGWMVGPFVDSIPRESLEATLTTLREAIAQTLGDDAELDAEVRHLLSVI